MSSLKPDYFIAHNGLPNILTTTTTSNRHLIRQATTTTNSRNRKNLQKSNCPHSNDTSSSKNMNGKNQKNKQNFTEVKAPTCEIQVIDASRRHHLRKSKKDLINYEIRALQRGFNTNINNNAVGNSNSLSSSQKFEADNECSVNLKRYSKEMIDNKYTHQRKYDNTIFRHDLPDRIVLPSLPI